MSGDVNNYEDDDPMDDFVLDDENEFGDQKEAHEEAPVDADHPANDVTGHTDEEFLEDLLSTDAPAEPAASAASGPVDGEEDAEDILFSDHTQGLEPGESFTPESGFSEEQGSSWDGDALELDSEAEVVASGEDVDSLDLDLVLDDDDDVSAEADEFLEDAAFMPEDEFVLDSEQELEIVGEGGDLAEGLAGGATDFEAVVIADDVLEFDSEEQLEAASAEDFEFDELPAEFLDEPDTVETEAEPVYGSAGSEPLADDGFLDLPEPEFEVPSADATEEEPILEFGDEQPAAAAADQTEGAGNEQGLDFIGDLSESAVEASELEEEGWEPLPGANMDALDEVEGLEPTSEEQTDGTPDSWSEAEDADYGEEYDIYADGQEEEAEVVGTYRSRGRTLSLFASLAASLLVVGTVALGVWRPELFGLTPGPQQVEMVQVKRPHVRVAVSVPPMPAAEAVEVVPVQEPEPPTVVVAEPPVVEQPEPVNEPEQPVPPVVPEVAVTPTEPPTVVPTVVPTVASSEMQWPVTQLEPETPSDNAGQGADSMMRVGNEMIVGGPEELPRMLTEGDLVPGLRAFAQLHNGNYFIGSVKAVNGQFVTLKMKSGEISLPRASLSMLTKLGSDDYRVLQEATSGSVRLRNKNRLVGKILQSIENDLVVLETRSNRVMLPKSDVGEIIPDADLSDIRLATTNAEEQWLGKVSARQIENGEPVVPVQVEPNPTKVKPAAKPAPGQLAAPLGSPFPPK